MKKFLATLLLLGATTYGWAQQTTETTVAKGEGEKSEKTIKFDRGMNNNIFVFKGESMAGLTISYGTLESDNSNLWLVLDQLNLRGQIFSIEPHYGFFYRDNNAVGVRIGYSYTNGALDNAALNLGDAADINLSIGNIGYTNRGFSAAIYHRSYMSIDRKGRFGLFGEWELAGKIARSKTGATTEGSSYSSIAANYRLSLTFAPGLAVYIFPNVCASVSFGLGGLQYNHIRQMDGDMNFVGKRDFSKLNFGLNLAEINIGVNVHLWSKKSDK